MRSIPNGSKFATDSVEAMFVGGPPSPGDLFRCILIDHSRASGKRRCGEKSPWHLMAVPELMALYPRAKFLWMIRDGRDVVRSCRGMPFFAWHPDWLLCQTWCRAAALAEKYRRQNPDRFLICRFETLVEDPVEEVKRIDEFLGLNFEPSQLVTSGRDGALSGDQWFMLKARQPPDSGRAYSWRQSSEADEVQYLTGLMHPSLLRYGYDSYWSPSVAGSPWRYYGYRALASLLRVSQISSRLTGSVVRAARCRRPTAVLDDNFPRVRSGELRGP